MSRTTIAIIAVAALLGSYVLLIRPLEEKRAEIKEELEMNYTTLVKNERFIKRTEKAGVELEDARQELEEMEQYIIPSVDTSIAFAQLQTKIQNIADSAGLRVMSVKPLAPINYKGYKGLPIYMDSMGGIQQLSRFLNYLDSTWEFISLDSLSVSGTTQNRLRIKVQLSGLMKT
jgi:Tfp pilus assembly protein PilO